MSSLSSRLPLSALLGVASAFMVACSIGASPLHASASEQQVAAGRYSGRTAQGFPLVLRVMNGGRAVAFGTTIRVECNTGPQNKPFMPPASFRVNSGRFGGTLSVRDGIVYKLTGAFGRNGSATGRFTYSSTRIVFGGMEVCVTRGWVGWTARRPTS